MARLLNAARAIFSEWGSSLLSLKKAKAQQNDWRWTQQVTDSKYI